MTTALKTLYGLKFNPFSQDVPEEALLVTPRVDDFGWRLEHGIAAEGGFAMVVGDFRLRQEHDAALALLPDSNASVTSWSDTCSGRRAAPPISYREMGELFGVSLKPHNRWAGFRSLRDKWTAHIEGSLMRPVLLVDEAQEMHHQVLAELRLLTQTRFDSRCILGVVLAGDDRLPGRLNRPELLPLRSRIRTRLALEAVAPDDLRACLQHRMKTAGNAKLMSTQLVTALCEHALGNYRAVVQMADELLSHAACRELDELDEKLYFDVFNQPSAPPPDPPARPARGRRGR